MMVMVIYVYFLYSTMSDKFVKKQVYECAVCKKLFNSKDEFNEHYASVHDMADKYVGSYFISKNGKYVGKVLRFEPLEKRLNISMISATTQTGFFADTLMTTYSRMSTPIKNFDERYKIVTPEVAKEHLKERFITSGFASLRHNSSLFRDFPEILDDDEYRLKVVDDDGN